jgi:diketogulonate reductase-like aldo/keto reductase
MNMPAVGLGTYLLPRDRVEPALAAALRLGYRRIDCAPVYFNEDAIGDALHELIRQGAVERGELFVTSKLASPFHRRERVRPALEKTLRDLRLDYLDLFLIHWPIAFRPVPIPSPEIRGWPNEDIDDSDGGKNIDPFASVHETWEAMEECVEAGLVRHLGVSNFPVALLHELLSRPRKFPPAVNQCERHPYLPQTRLVEFCESRGVRFQAYSPLGTPGYSSTLEDKEPVVLEDPTIVAIAGERGVSPSQVCLAWALRGKNVSVVVKSSDPDHQRDNLLASQLQLSEEEVRRIDSIQTRHRYFRPEDWWGSAGAVFD